MCVFVVYTEFGNKELLLSCKVEMKADKYGAGEFAKFVACVYVVVNLKSYFH